MSHALEASHAAARAITKHHAKSFYFSSFPLPRAKKRAAYAVYAFCRHADDRIDRAETDKEIVGAVKELRSLLEHLYEGLPAPHIPWALAFQETIDVYQIPKKYCEELIHGVELDTRSPVRIKTWLELREYCYYVASVVGLMMSCLFELKDEAGREKAISLGIAMQLTNILRDVEEDLENDRVYLPEEELAAFGISRAGRGIDYSSKQWKEYANLFASRAREHYRRAEEGIPLLARDGSQFTVWCMRHIYAAILDEVEKADWDVSERRRVSFGRKLQLAGKAWSDYKGSSRDTRQ